MTARFKSFGRVYEAVMRFKNNRQRKAVMARLRTISHPPFRSANHLPVRVSVIVPSTELEKNIPAKEFLRRVDSENRWFDNRFGGDTAVRETGSYLGVVKGKKKLIKEKGVIVESKTTTDNYERLKNEFARHIEQKRKEWKQQSVLAEVEGQTYIVPKQAFIADDKKFKGRVIVS